MSVLRGLLRSTASQPLLQPTAVLCNLSIPTVPGRTASRPARWCCSHADFSAHAPCVRFHTSLQRTSSSCNTSMLFGSPLPRQTCRIKAADAPQVRHVKCRVAHTSTQQQTNSTAFEEESQADDIIDDSELERETIAEEAEDQDEIGDDELQSMLQDDEASAGAITDTANTDWGAKALLVVQQVLQQLPMQELALFSLLASPKQKQLKIRLDKPADEFGSPTLDEIAIFSQQFSEEYHKALGEAAEDIGVEVSSPGAERPVRLPQDLERFQHLPMLVTFQLEDSSKTDTKVLELVAYNDAAGTAEWKLADVRQNRAGKGVSKLSKKQAGLRYTTAVEALLKVNLHLEV